MLTCEQAQRLASLACDRTLTPAEQSAWQQHVDTCSACAAHGTWLVETLPGELQLVAVPVLSADFTQRVLARLPEPAATEPWKPRLVPLAAVAAAFALGVFLGRVTLAPPVSVTAVHGVETLTAQAFQVIPDSSVSENYLSLLETAPEPAPVAEEGQE